MHVGCCPTSLLEPLPLLWLYHALRDHQSAHYAVKIAAAAAALQAGREGEDGAGGSDE